MWGLAGLQQRPQTGLPRGPWTDRWEIQVKTFPPRALAHTHRVFLNSVSGSTCPISRVRHPEDIYKNVHSSTVWHRKNNWKWGNCALAGKWIPKCGTFYALYYTAVTMNQIQLLVTPWANWETQCSLERDMFKKMTCSTIPLLPSSEINKACLGIEYVWDWSIVLKAGEWETQNS